MDSAPDQVVITAQTAAEAAGDIVDDIDDLIDAGVINQGQGNSLEAKLKLNEAIEELSNGAVNAAINKLNAFINEVNAMVSGGVLTQEEAQPLLDAANAIIDYLSG